VPPQIFAVVVFLGLACLVLVACAFDVIIKPAICNFYVS